MQNKTKQKKKANLVVNFRAEKAKQKKTVQNDAMTLPLIVAQSEHTTFIVSKQSGLCVVSILGTLPLLYCSRMKYCIKVLLRWCNM